MAGKYIEGFIMVTKRTTRRKIVAPPPATKSLPAATLGLDHDYCYQSQFDSVGHGDQTQRNCWTQACSSIGQKTSGKKVNKEIK